ncbi:MAG: polyprenyl synthetase family protein [Gammaproteobacteria bacterium]
MTPLGNKSTSSLETYQEHFNRLLADWIGHSTQGSPLTLHQTMEYAIFNGGKRLRPALVYATGESLGATTCQLNSAAVAIELVHCYSLIHDDLPAMDNASLRRGKPSCHCAFDEASAILAGDALQSLAFEILANDQQTEIPESYRLQMITTLAKAIGSHGMAGGQALDLAAEKQIVSSTMLSTIHQLKTGALIQAAIQLGALGAGIINVPQLKTLSLLGECIGAAYQIQDDILDVIGKEESLGKPIQQDKAAKKASYVNYYGLEKAIHLAKDRFQQANTLLKQLFCGTTPLSLLLEEIQQRNY